MVTLADAPVNLFSGELPDFDQIKALWRYVNSSESSRINFAEKAESASDPLVQGIALLLCGKPTEAIEKLKQGNECLQKSLCLGHAYRKTGDYDKAVKEFETAAKKADGASVLMELCETHRMAGQMDQAKEVLKQCSNLETASAEYNYQKGLLLDTEGLYDEAIECYEHAVDLDGEHLKALFQLAYSLDLRGDDELAMDYYKDLIKQNPGHVNALLNLAVLYEDEEHYESALECVESVLHSHPNHAKAQLFLKDIRSASVMVYDEEKEKRRDRQNKILEIPISDFELSVRSRNCLKKMSICTLGDLLRTTESELLSYKNFGETSLHEIKRILDIKGLRLGMALEEEGSSKPIDPEIVSQASPEILNKSIDELKLSVRARRALDRLNVNSIITLINKTEAELLGCKNFGVTSLNEIKERLTDFGLSLRTLE